MNKMKFPGQQIGEFSITAISDGYLSASLDLLSNIDPMEASKLQRDAGVSDPSSIHINCYLVQFHRCSCGNYGIRRCYAP